nr:DNA-3-methyladenine glycosylase [Bradyrhizobium brasilense]
MIAGGIPLVGIEAMATRRSADPDANRLVRDRAKGHEKYLAYSPCTVGESCDIQPALDGAWLFDSPFRIFRPVEPITDIEIRPRVNVTKDAHLPWRWTWRNPPSPQTEKLAA